MRIEQGGRRRWHGRCSLLKFAPNRFKWTDSLHLLDLPGPTLSKLVLRLSVTACRLTVKLSFTLHLSLSTSHRQRPPRSLNHQSADFFLLQFPQGPDHPFPLVSSYHNWQTRLCMFPIIPVSLCHYPSCCQPPHPTLSLPLPGDTTQARLPSFQSFTSSARANWSLRFLSLPSLSPASNWLSSRTPWDLLPSLWHNLRKSALERNY